MKPGAGLRLQRAPRRTLESKLVAVVVLQWKFQALSGQPFVYPNNDGFHLMLQLGLASNWGWEVGPSFNGPIWSISLEVVVYGLFFGVMRLVGSGRWVAPGMLLLGALGYLLKIPSQIFQCVFCFFLGGFVTQTGGVLVQDRDPGEIAVSDLKIVTKRAPSEAELADMMFAWKVAKHVKSNAIVYVKDGVTVGVGAGQMSRVDSTRIAARKAGDMAEALGLHQSPTIGSVVASDAFFPFPDGLLTAAEAGATAVIQPGGIFSQMRLVP